MTLWNAANDFVNALNGRSRNTSQGTDPSASFDPARTGEPSPGAPDRSDLGIGHAGGGGGYALPNRNPIGFAPPADPARGSSDESAALG